MSYPWRYRCPHGHAGVELGRNRFWCQTCKQENGRSGAYSKSELVDLASRTGVTGDAGP